MSKNRFAPESVYVSTEIIEIIKCSWTWNVNRSFDVLALIDFDALLCQADQVYISHGGVWGRMGMSPNGDMNIHHHIGSVLVYHTRFN